MANSGLVVNSNSSALTTIGAVTGSPSGTGLTLNANSTGNITMNGVISGGPITNSGSGAGTTSINTALSNLVTNVIENSATSKLQISVNDSTYTGPFTVTSGTLQVNNANAFASTNTIAIGAAGSFDLNGNSQTVGGLTGSGGVINSGTTGKTLTIAGMGNYSFGGTLFPATNNTLTVNMGGTQILSGNNYYTGATAISAGTLDVTGTLDGGNPAVAGTAITVNGTGIGTLELGSTAAAYSSTVAVNSPGTMTFAPLVGTFQIGALTNTAATPPTINLTDGTNPVTLIVGQNNTATTFTGVLSGTGGNFTKIGTATLTLTPTGTNQSTYTGTTSVVGGTLALNFASGVSNGTNILSSNSSLSMGGGTLQVAPSTAVNTSQTFAGTTIALGASAFSVSSNTTFTTTLALGAISRNTGATVDFGSVPTSAGSAITTTSGNVNGILGGFATQGALTTWAAVGTSTPFAGVVNGLTAGYSTPYYTNANVDLLAVTGNATNLSASVTALNSLRFNAAASYVLNMSNGMTLTAGGILETSTVAAAPVNINGTTLTSGNGQDLIVIQNNAQSNPLGYMAITAQITNNGSTAIGLTKSGQGVLQVGNGTNNTYTGPTSINAGILSTTSLAAGGQPSGIGASSNAAANLVLDGGTLQYLGSGATTDRSFTVGPAGGAIDSSGTGPLVITGGTAAPTFGIQTLTLTGSSTGANTISGVIANGAGADFMAVAKTGAGTWVLSGNNTYTGGTSISGGGTLQVSAIADSTGTSNLGYSTTVAGQPASASGAVTMTGGTLDLTSGVGTQTTIRPFTFTSGNNVLEVDSNSNLTLTGVLTYTAGTLSKTGNGTLTVANSVAANSGLVFSSISAGTLVLAGNTSGTPTSGVAAFNNINDIAAGATVKFGSNNLQQLATGTGQGVTIVSGGTLDMNGFNNELTALGGTNGTVTNNGTGASILTLGLNNQNGNFSGTVQNGASSLGISKLGSGIQILSGTVSYTGLTSVTGGTLQVNNLASSTLTLGSGSFNYVTGSSGAVNPITLAATSGTALTLSGTNAIGLDINASGTGKIALNSGATATTAGTTTVNLFPVAGTTLAAGAYTVLSAPGGGLAGATYQFGSFYNDTNFSLGSAATISTSGTTVNVTIPSAGSNFAVTAPVNLFWKGGFTGAVGVQAISNGVSTSNWTTDSALASASVVVPSSATVMNFSNTAETNLTAMTLGANMSVLGLVDSDTIAAHTFNLGYDGNSLTIGTVGISLSAAAVPLFTLNAPIVLNGNQSWTNGSTLAAGGMAIGGGISGTGNLTINANTSTAVNINTGGLVSATVNNSGSITNAGTGTGTVTISAPIGNNVQGLVQNSSTSPFTISGAVTVNGSTANPFAAIGSSGSPGSTNAAMTYSGNITGSGNITFANYSSNGTLTISSPSIANGGNLNLSNNSSGAITVSSASINNSGQVDNVGSGTGTTTISGSIGPNITEIVNTSNAGPLTVSGGNVTVPTLWLTNSSFTSNLTVGNTGLLSIASGSIISDGNGFGATNVSMPISGNTPLSSITLSGNSAFTLSSPFAVAPGGLTVTNNLSNASAPAAIISGVIYPSSSGAGGITIVQNTQARST